MIIPVQEKLADVHACIKKIGVRPAFWDECAVRPLAHARLPYSTENWREEKEDGSSEGESGMVPSSAASLCFHFFADIICVAKEEKACYILYRVLQAMWHWAKPIDANLSRMSASFLFGMLSHWGQIRQNNFAQRGSGPCAATAGWCHKRQTFLWRARMEDVQKRAFKILTIWIQVRLLTWLPKWQDCGDMAKHCW